MSHLVTCFWLLVEDQSVTATFSGTDSLNMFKDSNEFSLLNFLDVSQFSRTHIDSASGLEKYANALSWAVGSLLGCSMKDVTPRTVGEVVLSLFVLFLGTLLMAKIFADFATLKKLMDKDIEEPKYKKKLFNSLGKNLLKL
jgi:hypothetical protein